MQPAVVEAVARPQQDSPLARLLPLPLAEKVTKWKLFSRTATPRTRWQIKLGRNSDRSDEVALRGAC